MLDMIIKGYIFSILYGLICLAVAAVLYKVGVAKWITRKIVHILVGAEWFILYHFVGASVHFLVVCLAFLVLLFIAYRKKLMPMISSGEENAPGTVYYAVAMSAMAAITLFVPSMILPFGIGVLCTSLGDGLAGLVGQSIKGALNPNVYKNKSLFGTVINFCACFVSVFLFSRGFDVGLGWFACFAVAIFALELELFTGKGFDNLSITLGTAFLAFGFCHFDGMVNYIVPILMTPIIIAFSINKKALTVGGIIAALVLDVAVSVCLGNFGFVLLLSFFCLGIVADKIKKRKQKTGQSIENRGECRDAVQVLANGGIAALLAVLFLVTNQRIFVVAFSAALAEALADTAASGIGSLSDKVFDPFKMKKTTKGISGGMTLLGTFASLLGSAIIAAVALAFSAVTIIEALVIMLSGFFGGVFDSFLGSVFQVKYKCKKCGKIVEKKNHCDLETDYYQGLKFVDNDLVNFLSTVFSCVVSALAFVMLSST